MDLIKRCPTCQAVNRPDMVLCERCFADIAGVEPITGGVSPSGKVVGAKSPVKPVPAALRPVSPSVAKVVLDPFIDGLTAVSGETPAIKPAASAFAERTIHLAPPRLLLAFEGQDIEIEDGDTVGRHGKGREFFADQGNVSRRHARFFVEKNVWYVEDLKSTNGVYVDDRRLPEGGKAALRKGQRIGLSRKLTLVVQDLR